MTEPLTIFKVENTDKSKIKLNKGHNILKHPFRALFVGQSGSGKTNCFVSILSNPKFLKGYFDITYLFSGSGSLDQIYQALDLKPEFIIDDFSNFNEDLGRIFDIQVDLVQRLGIENAPKTLIIFDDCIDFKEFRNSPNLQKLFIRSRHFGVSTLIGTQHYNAVQRINRIQATNIFLFGTSDESVVKNVFTEQQSKYIKNWKHMLSILNKATEAPHSFLYINKQVSDSKKWYGSNLDIRYTIDGSDWMDGKTEEKKEIKTEEKKEV